MDLIRNGIITEHTKKVGSKELYINISSKVKAEITQLTAKRGWPCWGTELVGGGNLIQNTKPAQAGDYTMPS